MQGSRVTSSSGPGIALKGEALGLAIMTELPLVVVNSQRGGLRPGCRPRPSSPDLYQAVYGRNGDTRCRWWRRVRPAMPLTAR